MDVPLEIAFRGIEPKDALRDLVREGIDSLERVHPRVTSCRVMIEEVTRGVPHVRLDVGIPGNELVVNREPPADAPKREVAQAVRDAFDIARRRLREHRKRRSLDSKRGELPSRGRIMRLVVETLGNRYGFLLARDGRQIFFHESAVRKVTYDQLEEGMEMRFVEVGGKDGPQASVVAPLAPGDLSRPREDALLREPT